MAPSLITIPCVVSRLNGCRHLVAEVAERLHEEARIEQVMQACSIPPM